ANPVAVKMIGSDREDIIGNICHEFFATMETQCPILNLGQDMDNSERELLSKDGRRIPVLKTVVSVMLGGKEHLIESFVDLTERKNMEEALRQAKEAAEAATAARAMFLANMSHEIRTPLNAIMGFVHLAIKTLLTDEQREYLTKIQNASKSLLEIVNEILDFSKIDAGKIYVEEKDFRIENILEELADLFADQVAEKGFEMNIICEPDVPATLIGDQLRIKQILINLMSNAVKFTPAGEIFMGVSCLKKTDDTVFVSFMVKDTGIGIAGEKHETIFSAFTQGDGSTTRTYAGTGLGLAISRRLAALMGGEIRVESEEEKGSTFTFTLPLKSRQGKVKHPYRDSDLHGFRALVVDDNENSRKVFSKMTKSFGIAVQAAASGEEALAMLKGAAHAGNPYHLALVDMQMPGLDGLDVSRKIRSDARLAGIPIIMISGFATDRDIQNGLSIGVSGFLLKPVKCSVLFETVLEALGKKSGSKTDGLEQALKTDRTWTPLFPGARVLLAEDDSVNQEVVVKLLGMEGIVVDIAEDGAKAVEAVRRRSYDAILMDIQMPELDGYEATRCIRALELEAQGFQGEKDHQPSARPKRVPIVAMTAHAMQGDRNKCLEAGMDGYVSKPIDPDRLVSALKRWMDPSATKDRPMPAVYCERLSSFPALDGLDVKAGLRRLRGDTALYGNLLRDFSLKATARIDAIKDALVAHDTKKAMTLVHGLKGVAGNLSAWKLHLAATDLETALRTGKGDQGIPSSRILTKFGAMEDALAGTLGSIRDCEKFLEREAGHADDKEVEEIMGAKEVRSMLVQFSEHLAAKHVAVQDLMPRVARCLRARGVDREIKQLRAKVDMFDFDGAREILKSVVEILGISL
ncbi:MAG TPA: response regulator, partial [Desulfobacteria bacterium]|nr:response regulator [Desulfobacteria bacterium]